MAREKSKRQVPAISLSTPARGKPSGSSSTPRPPRSVTPDSIDFRDRVYSPPVERAPAPQVLPAPAPLHPVLNQGSTDACTGFGLATLIHVLLSRRDQKLGSQVSPYMLYGMARHYDNLPGTDP